MDTPEYLGYIENLLKLHQLIEQDADEGEEGDKIRDDMDDFFHHGNEEYIEEFNNISAFLYELNELELNSIKDAETLLAMYREKKRYTEEKE